MSVEGSVPRPRDSAPQRAVFLSYVREDAESVRRIADALRAFGVEVWFDMNELRGGDARDSKIRNQIRTCTLCIPVISAATQSRGEGYFRREWKIAVERTHDMASGVPFLIPVVIDDTTETEALVPEEFMRVQWTRLPMGVPTPEFVQQVKRLLEAPRKPVLKNENPKPPTFPPGFRTAAQIQAEAEAAAAMIPKRSLPRWTWIALTAVLIGIAVTLVVSYQP